MVLKYGDDAPIPDPYLLRAGAPRNQAEQAAEPNDATPLLNEGEPKGPLPFDPGPPLATPPGWGPSPYQPMVLQVAPASQYASWALVVGMFGLVCFGAGPILGALAIVLGILGWREVTRASGKLRGRLSAGAGIAAGFLAIVFFAGEVALYLTLVRPARIATIVQAKASDPPAVSPTNDDDSSNGAAAAPVEPPSTTSAVTSVGHITVVDVALGVASLPNELRRQHAEATAHGERLLLETTSPSCSQCQGIASSLSDPRMQTALEHVRLVRVDRDPFEEDLAELEIPSRPFPGFFLLDSDLKVTDGINGGEWDDDIAMNIAPVLGPFVRGNYAKRRSPWKKLPRPGGTVL